MSVSACLSVRPSLAGSRWLSLCFCCCRARSLFLSCGLPRQGEEEGGLLLPFVAAAACGAAALGYARAANPSVREEERGGGEGGSSKMMYDWSQRSTAWSPTSLDVKHELGAVCWSETDPFKLLVGSAEDDPFNQLSIVERVDGRLVTTAVAEHRYQPAKVMFLPGQNDRYFASASDTVYLWDQSKQTVGESGRTKLQTPYERDCATFADFEQTLEPLALPPQWATGKYTAPIVGFDIVDTVLVAAHCDGQCMVWDLNIAQAAGRKDPPLLNHAADSTSRALYDVVCAPLTSDMVGRFAACGVGGVFLYDARTRGPVMQLPAAARFGVCHKLAWNAGSDRQIAVAFNDDVAVLDLRQEYALSQTYGGLPTLTLALYSPTVLLLVRQVHSVGPLWPRGAGPGPRMGEPRSLMAVHLRRRRQRLHVGHRRRRRGGGGGGLACLRV